MDDIKKHRWVRDDIVIDFKVPRYVQDLIEEMERFDEEDNEIAYLNYSEGTECCTKDLVYEGVLTDKQRVTLIKKYH